MIGLGCAPRIIVSADSAKSEDKVMPKIQTASIKIGYETCGDGEPLLLIMGLGLPGAAWIGRLPFLTQFN
jgi:hypothetical protein